jgi:hypothetical protein
MGRRTSEGTTGLCHAGRPDPLYQRWTCGPHKAVGVMARTTIPGHGVRWPAQSFPLGGWAAGRVPLPSACRPNASIDPPQKADDSNRMKAIDVPETSWDPSSSVMRHESPVPTLGCRLRGPVAHWSSEVSWPSSVGSVEPVSSSRSSLTNVLTDLRSAGRPRRLSMCSAGSVRSALFRREPPCQHWG